MLIKVAFAILAQTCKPLRVCETILEERQRPSGLCISVCYLLLHFALSLAGPVCAYVQECRQGAGIGV